VKISAPSYDNRNKKQGRPLPNGNQGKGMKARSMPRLLFSSVADPNPDPVHRIHMFLGLPDPDPLVRGMDPDPDPDPDPSIIMQK
jgi:hypothetical protein